MSRIEIAVALVVSAALVAAHESGHAESIEALAVGLLVTGVVTVPLLTLAHELGHAVAATALTSGPVVVRIGDDPSLVSFSIGRVAVRLSPRGSVARCDVDDRALPGAKLLVVALAGPAASVLLATGLAVVAVGLSSEGSRVLFSVVALAASASLVLGLTNTVPIRRLPRWWPGSSIGAGPSDGMLALRALLRSRSEHRELQEGADRAAAEHDVEHGELRVEAV